MPGTARRTGIAVVAAVVVLGIAFALLSDDRGGGRVGPGSPAPGFDLPRIGGDGSLSLADLRGRVVLVNFWATWCKPCEDEMPAMERLYGQLAGEPFELVAISVDRDAEDVRAFRERLGLSFPILHDPGKVSSEAYQTYKFPETLLIDPAGRIVSRFVGPREWDSPAYVERVRSLVEEGETAS